MDDTNEVLKHISEKLKVFQSKCILNVKKYPNDEFLISAIDDFKKTKLSIQSGDSNVMKTVFRSFTKAVLDMTFFDEKHLLEDDFKSRTSSLQMMQIIEIFDSVEKLCLMVENDYKIVELLGEEMAECLLWRRGALLYMFCHCKWEDVQWKEDNSKQYHQFLLQGVKELQKMLELRGSVDWSDASLSSNDTSVLTEKGVYSDTHLLAIMYAAEMCYWYVKAGAPKNNQILATGRDFLRLYIAIVEGPLRRHASWKSEQAKKYLEELS